ncbi:MAG: hypothetical protein MZU84_07915, partial [Sphingobacterium sp.]|nr:hypothetical protein [Sphingobacterium sp.]
VYFVSSYVFIRLTQRHRQLSSAPKVRQKRNFPVEIIEVMRNFPARKKMRLSVAYVMIRDVNDTDRHMGALMNMLKGSGIRVNLLPALTSCREILMYHQQRKG